MISNMIITLQFCLLLVILSVVPVVHSERYIIPESKITEVTIGGTIAQVSRTFSVPHVSGSSHTIVVSHLPLAVDEKSIQITGKGSATVVSTVFENQITYKENDEEYITRVQMLDALSKSINAFEHKLHQENKTVTARLNAVAQYVEDVVSRNPSHTSPTRIPIDQLAELLDYQEKEFKNSNDKVVALNVVQAAVREISERVTSLVAALRKTGSYKNDLLLLQSMGELAAFPVLAAAWRDLSAQVAALPAAPRHWPLSSQSKQLHINIHVPKSASEEHQELSFEVEYTVSPASWTVEYDLRVQKDTTPATTAKSTPYTMRVGLYAVVAQSTGEDWAQVQLHLSTTQAQQRIHAPTAPTRLSLDFRSEYVESLSYSTGAAAMRKSARVAPQMMAAGMADMAAAEAVQMDMAGAGFTGSSGQVGSPVVFHPEHAINITSNHPDRDLYSASGGSPAVTRSTRLFIRDAVLYPAVFSYCVPTKESSAYIKAWTTGEPANAGAVEMPLLESHNARVFIENALTGTTAVQATQPGSPVRVDLGRDKNIQVTSTHVLPQKGSRTDDKSTWFVTDKVKYLMENVEYAFSVRSTYDAPQLVVLSEYLPHVSDDGIKVELLQPAPTSTLSVTGSSSSEEVWSEQDFLAAVLAHPSLASPSAATATTTDDRMQAFVAKGSGNVVWARWVQPGQTVRAGLQYKIIWPDGKQVQKDWHRY